MSKTEWQRQRESERLVQWEVELVKREKVLIDECHALAKREAEFRATVAEAQAVGLDLLMQQGKIGEVVVARLEHFSSSVDTAPDFSDVRGIRTLGHTLELELRQVQASEGFERMLSGLRLGPVVIYFSQAIPPTPGARPAASLTIHSTRRPVR